VRKAFLLVVAGILSSAFPLCAWCAGDDLAERVAEAIRKGREVLLPRLGNLVRDPPNDYPMGRVALPLAAVLKAGVSSKHPTVVAAFERLETMQLEKTYSVACYLFALDALWQRSQKESLREAGANGLLDANRARGPVRAKIAECVEWLAKARAIGQGYWDYGAIGKPGTHRHDFSNSQFAILGLQIGLEHGVPIPRQVFTEIAAQFVRSIDLTGGPETVRIQFATSLDDLLEAGAKLKKSLAAAVQTHSAEPGGWAYTASRENPYASMTAAGASSLLVALNAIEPGALRREAEKGLSSAYVWITKNFREYTHGGRQYYYTLYSLEKVGDLGRIERFGSHDWYQEGAEELLKRQRDNGSWGDYVDTSFALLFLTRATRLKPFSAPRITTRAQGVRGEEVNHDLVYISRLEGYVSANEVFGYLAETRRSDLVTLLEEVVRNYARDVCGNLVPQLQVLWGGRSDGVGVFSRKALEQITGEKHPKPEGFTAWYEHFRSIQALARQKTAAAADLAKLLGGTTNPVLKGQVLDLAGRHGARELVADLVRELASETARSSPAHRRRVHGLLALWCGDSVRAPADDADERGWEEHARAWGRWWAEHGETFHLARKVMLLVEEIERSAADSSLSPARLEKAADAVVQKLVDLGPAALPLLRPHLERPESSFFLVEAYERLSGKAIGLRELDS
jgi:hypothetical protein